MAKHWELTQEQRDEAYGMLVSGMSQDAVALRIGCTRAKLRRNLAASERGIPARQKRPKKPRKRPSYGILPRFTEEWKANIRREHSAGARLCDLVRTHRASAATILRACRLPDGSLAGPRQVVKPMSVARPKPVDKPMGELRQAIVRDWDRTGTEADQVCEW